MMADDKKPKPSALNAPPIRPENTLPVRPWVVEKVTNYLLFKRGLLPSATDKVQ
jgi:hypothetical protein